MECILKAAWCGIGKAICAALRCLAASARAGPEGDHLVRAGAEVVGRGRDVAGLEPGDGVHAAAGPEDREDARLGVQLENGPVAKGFPR